MSQNKWIQVGKPETKRINLDEEFWVESKKYLTAGEYDDFVKSHKAKNGEVDWKAQDLLALMVVDWNFHAEDNTKLPVTQESMRNFTMTAIAQLVQQIQEGLGDDSPFTAEVQELTPQPFPTETSL